jgi:MFS family permease
MITDWFAGKEIATAMAVFVNSWAAGIALSLLVLPTIGTAYGVSAVNLFVAALIVIGIFLTLTYRSPPNEAAAVAASGRLDLKTLMALTAAALIWGLFNVAFAIVFSFGPTLLVERGWTIAQAGSVISIALWLAVFSVPLGGFLADRLKMPQVILVAGALAFAGLTACFAHTSAVVFSLIALGLIAGQPAGPIMSLPARVLSPATRAIGMGIFYTIYYGAMMLGPIIGGAAAKWQGSAAAAFDFGVVVLLACPLLLLAFNAIAAARMRVVTA